MFATGEDGVHQWDGQGAFRRRKPYVAPGMVDPADVTRTLGD